MSDTIECDFPCSKCGYNLRTLKLDAACPECGTAVRAGLPADATLFIRGLTPEAARAHAWRNWRLLMAIILIFPVAMVTASWWLHGTRMIPLFLVGGVVMLGWFGWSFWRRLIGRFRNGVFVVGADEVLWRYPTVREVRVRRDEVSRIDEDSYDITVRAKTGGRYVEIPRPIEHFAFLREHFSRWLPVTAPQTVMRVAGILAVNIAWMVSLMSLCAVEDAYKVTLIGMGGIGIGVWLIRAELRSQTSSPVKRWFSVGIVVVMLLFILGRIAVAWVIELAMR